MAIKRVGASQGRFCDRIFFDSSLQILTSVIGGGARQGSHIKVRRYFALPKWVILRDPTA